MRIRIIIHISLILLVSAVAAVNVSGQEASPDITIDYPGQKPLWINCDAVNIRSKPDMKSEKIGLLARDAKVYLIDQSGSWSQVSFGEGKQGWVFTELLTAEAPVNMALNAEDYVDDSLGMAPRGLVLGPITESPMQVRMNRTVVPAYTVQGTTCVFVGDLEKCGFKVSRDDNYRVIIGLTDATEPATAPAELQLSTDKVKGDVTYPRWRLFISNRQIPAYEYKGRVLIQLLDLSVLGTLDIDLDNKRISFTSGEIWEDSYGLVFNFGEPAEQDAGTATESMDTSKWEYVYLRDTLVGMDGQYDIEQVPLRGARVLSKDFTNAHIGAMPDAHGVFVIRELVVSDCTPETISDKSIWLIAQISTAKVCDNSVSAGGWVPNMGLVDARLYLSSSRVSGYLLRVVQARADVQLQKVLDELEAARLTELKRNGNRPLKITYYYLEPDILDIPVAYTRVLNLTSKTVDAFELDLLCYDTFDRPVKGFVNGNRQTMLYQGLLNSLYEITTYVTLYGRATTTKIHPELKRVHFTDGTVWKAD